MSVQYPFRPMRIAGKRVDTDTRIEVLNPYDNTVVGTVPAARPVPVARDTATRELAPRPRGSTSMPRLTRVRHPR